MKGEHDMATQIIALQQPFQNFNTITQKTQTTKKPRRYTHAELDALTDNQLIDLTLEGKTKAFEILVKRHQRQMYALALKMVRNHEDASDIAQDVFLKAYEVLGSFQKKSSFHTWLYRITMNFCINHLRRDKAQYHVELESYHAVKSAEAFENLDTMEIQDQLNEAIRRLPEKQQKTIILRVCEGLPYKEIAKILGCSIGTVKANYFHAVKNIKRFMKSTIIAHA
jgi:RNA polymerase sigma-70 factor (ECF subfamily)